MRIISRENNEKNILKKRGKKAENNKWAVQTIVKGWEAHSFVAYLS